MDAVHRDRDGRAGLPAQRRRGAGGQLRPDPRARRIRHRRPEEDVISSSSWRAKRVISRRHDRARSRLGGHRSQDHAPRPTATATASTARRSSPRTRAYADVMLAYVRFGPGVGGIGSVLIPTQAPKASSRGKPSTFMTGEEWAELHFDNVYVPPRTCCSSEGGFKKQIAGFNVERIGNTARSLALGRYAYERARAVGAAAQAVRPPAVRVPGPAVEVRRHEDEARRRRSSCSTARRPTPTAAFPRPRRPRSPRPSATRPASTSQRSDAGHGRHGLQPGRRWSSTACASAAAG